MISKFAVGEINLNEQDKETYTAWLVCFEIGWSTHWLLALNANAIKLAGWLTVCVVSVDTLVCR